MSNIYYFQAKDHNQRIVKGRVKASSREEVEEKLISRQLVLIQANTKKQPQKSFLIGGVAKGALVVAIRQLSFLINASVPVVQALDTVSLNTSDVGLKKVLYDLARSVESGQSFSSALKQYSHIFDEVFINMVHSGEEGGSLDVMLSQLAVYIEKSHSVRKKVRGGMLYPGFITVVAGLIVVGIMVFLVPKFENIFADSGQNLPGLTQIVIDTSRYMRNNAVTFIIGLVGMIVGLAIFLRTDVGRRIKEMVLMGLPVFGDLMKKYYIARFSRTVSSLLSSGGQIVASLKIGAKSTGSIFFREAVLRVSDMVETGHTLSKCISKEKIFPGLIKNMISVGEETGNLDEVLKKIADFYEEQVDVAVESMLKLIEPILIVGIAVVISFIVIAMYLPIFQMGELLSGG